VSIGIVTADNVKVNPFCSLWTALLAANSVAKLDFTGSKGVFCQAGLSPKNGAVLDGRTSAPHARVGEKTLLPSLNIRHKTFASTWRNVDVCISVS
jgi:hypothetical protein